MQQEIWFQKYRIIRLLGRGGNAKVYLAEHIKLNSYRAIKYISNNHPLYDLQLKEAQILKNLKHSCIPIIYDIEENEDGSYIVEQYLEGDTLRDYVEAKGTMSDHIIIHFALQLCDLIQYLHSTTPPVLYLDLKPENIIITGRTLKLVDFGSALFRDEVNQKQDYYGTRGYAAPEMYHHQRIDERSDVYGIGMLLYFMVTGVSLNNLVGMDNIDFINNCPKDLKKIINRCLKYNPSQRYASVSHLSKQLSTIRRKNIQHYKSSSSIRFAVAGAQPRIGVTHLSFRLCSYFIHEGTPCCYIEKNGSRCVWLIKNRYEGMTSQEEFKVIEGIPMLEKDQSEEIDTSKYQVSIEDFGCLTKDNLTGFLEADVRLLVLGARDWELTYAEQILDMVAEYKDIVYLFNFLDGRQFRQVMKSMERRNCYRIPYEPDPFSKITDRNGYEFFKELAGLYQTED